MKLPLVQLLGAEGGGRMWHRLGPAAAELRLDATLANGQAFGWSRVGSDAADATRPWVGVVGKRVILLKEDEAHVDFCCPSAPKESPDTLREELRDFFQLETPLADLYARWRSADERTSAVLDALPGLRILRQEPTECLFSFICSSNNNIGRITGILARLRAAYGAEIPLLDPRPFRADGQAASPPPFFAFPTIERLAEVPEAELRELGLGYRARYVRETAQLLLERGGADWLLAQRRAARGDAQAALIELSGVGPKVADCVALFSLDQAATVPVDVHVWQIACRDYDGSLQEAKSLTPAVYERVGSLFRDRFGAHAGWAHSVLFAAELPAFRALLPADVQQRMEAFRLAERERSAEKRRAKREQGAPDAALADEATTPHPPPRAAAASSPKSGKAAAKAAVGSRRLTPPSARAASSAARPTPPSAAAEAGSETPSLASARADGASAGAGAQGAQLGVKASDAAVRARPAKRAKRAIVLESSDDE